MDELTTRRRMMTAEGLIDTSPKIVLFDKACDYALTGERPDNGYGITETYSFEPRYSGKVHLHYYINGKESVRPINYQYTGEKADGTIRRDWFYNLSVDKPYRSIGWSDYQCAEIRFSVLLEDIEDIYAYCRETGQIFFAGKNTPYYGYRNLSEVPEGSAS